MNRTDLLSLKNHIHAAISQSETVENLWATCFKIIKEMKFDYFSYHIQYPTPFTNPRVQTYGNYPLDVSSFLTRKSPHRSTGHLKITPEQLTTFNQAQNHENLHTIKINDSIFFITQSTQKPEGVVEHFFLARTHHEIDRHELKISRTLMKTITEEAYRKLFNLNNTTSQTIFLSPREKEILLWGADGKTSEEIAIILGLSQDAINFHHKKIQKKLNTTNRVQAIAHAIVKGYL
ncbi:LuxR family transcriptional activator of rhlAB and lasB [Pseudomonas sp. TE12234]